VCVSVCQCVCVCICVCVCVCVFVCVCVCVTLPQVQSMYQLLCAQKEGFLFDNSDVQVLLDFTLNTFMFVDVLVIVAMFRSQPHVSCSCT
jgi:hypothetical protein